MRKQHMALASYTHTQTSLVTDKGLTHLYGPCFNWNMGPVV